MTSKTMAIVAACGAACGLAGVAQAQPYLVNGAGATLMESVFEAPASTNDFCDLDGDGNVLGDQLAPYDISPPFLPDMYYTVTYRVTGSGNGFAELRDWGASMFATAPDLDPANLTLNSDTADAGYTSREPHILAGILQGIGNSTNPGGYPLRSTNDGTYALTSSTDNATTGIQVDFAALDVPVSWFVLQGGTPRYNNVPGDVGFGNNPRVSANKDGSVSGQSNKLKSLTSPNGHTINVNASNPDDLTVFDFAIAQVPVAAITNFGTGLQQIDMSDLRHLAATGRRVNGENLVKVTRDSGSGTRNAFMNGIGLDPSYGVGENIGRKTEERQFEYLGPAYQPSNKGGSSRLEATVLNSRLAIGHTGAERGVSSSWLTLGRAELLAVRADLKGGTDYVRPTLDAVLDGGVNGYNITGPGSISSIGDPRTNSAAVGGWGWDADETGPSPYPVQPMKNEAAAGYINNFLRSISVIESLNPDQALFSPGEYMATNFLLVAAAANAPAVNPPAGADFIPIIPNPDFNPDLAALYGGDAAPIPSIFARSEFASFNTGSAGLVPRRIRSREDLDGSGGIDPDEVFDLDGDGMTNDDGNASTGDDDNDEAYTDGVFNGTHYVDQGGNDIAYGGFLTMRNKIAYDFNGDGVRNINDVDDMMAAYGQRNGGATWNAPDGVYGAGAGDDAIIEVLGDGTNDGNFDAEDIRYWADGLVLDGVSGDLDRAAGFAAVDDAAGTNFFGTMLANTGATYDSGDSRADVAGSVGTTRGYNPVGHDGVIDGADIDYVYANFGDWTDTAQAIDIDLSCDMNGDLLINQDDVCIIVNDILETAFGDINFDGSVDGADEGIATGNMGNAGGYADGDVNGDGMVSQDDVDIITGAASFGCNACPADLSPAPNGDGMVNTNDFFQFLTYYQAQDARADFSPAGGDGQINTNDFFAFLAAYQLGCS